MSCFELLYENMHLWSFHKHSNQTNACLCPAAGHLPRILGSFSALSASMLRSASGFECWVQCAWLCGLRHSPLHLQFSSEECSTLTLPALKPRFPGKQSAEFLPQPHQSAQPPYQQEIGLLTPDSTVTLTEPFWPGGGKWCDWCHPQLSRKWTLQGDIQ